MTHTPGPWYRTKGKYASSNYISGNGHEVAKALYWSGSEDAAEVEANARLIAAAPQLLEACKALIIPPKMPIADCPADAGTFFPCECGFHNAIEQARAAIAAAEGGEL